MDEMDNPQVDIPDIKKKKEEEKKRAAASLGAPSGSGSAVSAGRSAAGAAASASRNAVVGATGRGFADAASKGFLRALMSSMSAKMAVAGIAVAVIGGGAFLLMRSGPSAPSPVSANLSELKSDIPLSRKPDNSSLQMAAKGGRGDMAAESPKPAAAKEDAPAKAADNAVAEAPVIPAIPGVPPAQAPDQLAQAAPGGAGTSDQMDRAGYGKLSAMGPDAGGKGPSASFGAGIPGSDGQLDAFAKGGKTGSQGGKLAASSIRARDFNRNVGNRGRGFGSKAMGRLQGINGLTSTASGSNESVVTTHEEGWGATTLEGGTAAALNGTDGTVNPSETGGSGGIDPCMGKEPGEYHVWIADDEKRTCTAQASTKVTQWTKSIDKVNDILKKIFTQTMIAAGIALIVGGVVAFAAYHATDCSGGIGGLIAAIAAAAVLMIMIQVITSYVKQLRDLAKQINDMSGSGGIGDHVNRVADAVFYWGVTSLGLAVATLLATWGLGVGYTSAIGAVLTAGAAAGAGITAKIEAGKIKKKGKNKLADMLATIPSS